MPVCDYEERSSVSAARRVQVYPELTWLGGPNLLAMCGQVCIVSHCHTFNEYGMLGILCYIWEYTLFCFWNCPRRAVTDENDNLVSSNNNHSHPPNDVRCTTQPLLCWMKQLKHLPIQPSHFITDFEKALLQSIAIMQLPNCNSQGLFLSLHTSNMEEDSAIRPAGQLPRRGKYQEVL